MDSNRMDIRSLRYASAAGDVGRSTTSTTAGSGGYVSGMSAITGNLKWTSARLARRMDLLSSSRARISTSASSAPPRRPIPRRTLRLSSVLVVGRLIRCASSGVPGKMTWYPVDVDANGEPSALVAPEFLDDAGGLAAAWAAAWASSVLPSSLA